MCGDVFIKTVLPEDVHQFLAELHDVSVIARATNKLNLSFAMLSAKWIVNSYVEFYNRLIAEELASGQDELLPVGNVTNNANYCGATFNPSNYIKATGEGYVVGNNPKQSFKTLQGKMMLTTPQYQMPVKQFWEMMHLLYTHSPPYTHPKFGTNQDLFDFLKRNPSYLHSASMMELFFYRR